MNKLQLPAFFSLVLILLIVAGCGSSKEFNTLNGFMPESDLSPAELEQLRDQVVHHSELDESPQVEGGMVSILMGLRYPEEARRAEAGGRVVIDFIVDLEGNARDLIVAQSAGYGMGEEAIRLVKSGTYIPAKRNGEAVVARQTLPVTFGLP